MKAYELFNCGGAADKEPVCEKDDKLFILVCSLRNLQDFGSDFGLQTQLFMADQNGPIFVDFVVHEPPVVGESVELVAVKHEYALPDGYGDLHSELSLGCDGHGGEIEYLDVVVFADDNIEQAGRMSKQVFDAVYVVLVDDFDLL